MNKLAFPLLAVLADGKFHSGEALAQRFGVTRATVCHALHAAQAMGITVFSVRGRGYRLPHAVTLLDAESIVHACGDAAASVHVQVLSEVDSTNRYLMQERVRGLPNGSCVTAQIQTAGRGRRGRNWVTQLGGSLAFSLLWRFHTGASGLSGLSLVVGLALLQALHAEGFNDVQLKWPNDLLVRQQDRWHKLGGILIELQGDMEGPSTAVIGIGLNLALDAEAQRQIEQPVIGLNQLADTSVNPNRLLGVCLRQLVSHLNRFTEHGFAVFKDAWVQHHAFHHQPVDLHLANGQVLSGQVMGVAEDGGLLVQTAQGIQRFHAGELSVRSAV